MYKSSTEYDAKHRQNIKLLIFINNTATTENITNGRFPLARPLLLVTRGEATGMARTFIDFARHPANHDLVREFSFVPAP